MRANTRRSMENKNNEQEAVICNRYRHGSLIDDVFSYDAAQTERDNVYMSIEMQVC